MMQPALLQASQRHAHRAPAGGAQRQLQAAQAHIDHAVAELVVPDAARSAHAAGTRRKGGSRVEDGGGGTPNPHHPHKHVPKVSDVVCGERDEPAIEAGVVEPRLARAQRLPPRRPARRGALVGSPAWQHGPRRGPCRWPALLAAGSVAAGRRSWMPKIYNCCKNLTKF